MSEWDSENVQRSKRQLAKNLRKAGGQDHRAAFGRMCLCTFMLLFNLDLLSLCVALLNFCGLLVAECLFILLRHRLNPDLSLVVAVRNIPVRRDKVDADRVAV